MSEAHRAHPWRHRLALAARLAVAVALFVWLATQVDWSALRAVFAAAHPERALAALGVLWLGLAIAVLRWRRVLLALGSPLGLGETARIFASGLFLSLFLPTTIGGDVYRLARVSQGGFGPARGGVSMLAERGVGLLALLLLVSPVVALHPATHDLLPLAAALGAAAVGAIAAVLFWGRAVSDFLSRRLPALAPALRPGVRGKLLRQGPAIFAASLLIHLTTVGAVLLLALALNVPLRVWDALALVPLVILAGQIPISPGGLGVREAGFVYFLGRVGIAKAPALAVGLAWLAALYVTGAVAAVFFLFDRRAARQAGPSPAMTPPGGLDTT